MILRKPCFDAFLMEKVFVIVTWHPNDVAIRYKSLAANETLLQRIAREVFRLPRFGVL